jgi:membrane-associated PAP2 superfamily phosphatase
MRRAESLFLSFNLAALAVTGAALVWLSRHPGIDFALAGYFYDPALGRFPLKDAPLLAQAGHTGLRWLAISVWLAAVVLAAASWKAAALRGWRGPLLYFTLAAAATTLAVGLLKYTSGHSCPWDLVPFGGQAHWFPLLGTPEGAPGPGRCWPGAHAAGGFALLAGYFALRDAHRAAARGALGAALALGALMSLTQVARGAHFLTHNLWSLWLAWLCCLAGYCAWRRAAPALAQ